ncbi:dynactin subunit 2 [Copidosoma floridanum]|uniref:dynactin subunit 2 n=1 Tax=Copidosoma floridanum TaxID=29053 RepID=UPI000C6F8213|nr:dynactin subunit 2 [Copidosoma floridanum]
MTLNIKIFQDCPGSMQKSLIEDGASVEKIYLNASEAFMKFKEKHISAESLHFSDTACSSMQKYNFSRNIAIRSTHNQDESISEKCHRLKSEINELMNQINAIKELAFLDRNEDTKCLVDIICQIESAGNQLTSLSIEKMYDSRATTNVLHNQEIRFKELLSQIEIFKRAKTQERSCSKRELFDEESLKQESLKYQMTYFPERAKIEEGARLSHLERRVGYLENIIGVNKNVNSKFFQLLRSQGILSSIKRIIACACILNSSQLDIVENRVTSLLRKMDEAEEKKNSVRLESKYEKKILELFSIVKQSESESQILPQIINRMRSLSNLHKKACEFNNNLDEFGHLQQHINGVVLNNTDILEEIQKNFSKNMEIIANNVSILTERVKELKN